MLRLLGQFSSPMSLLRLVMNGRCIRAPIEVNCDEILQKNEEFRPMILRKPLKKNKMQNF